MKKTIIAVLILNLFTGCSTNQPEASNNENGASVIKYTNVNHNIANENIYGSFEVEPSYSFDITVPANLITEGASKVVVAEVVFGDIHSGVIDTDNPTIPLTPIDVVSFKVLSGEKDIDLKTVYVSGGYIAMEDYIKASPTERVSKLGWDKLSLEETQDMYFNVETPGQVEIKQGEPYVAVLSVGADGSYHISMNGYGLFTSNNRSSGGEYLNVITSNVLKSEDFVTNN